MLAREDVLRLLKQNKKRLQELGVKRIGISGSVARNQIRKESDIDVVVDFHEGKKTFDNFMELAFFLEELFGRKVDLLTVDAISPHFKPYIEREAIYETV